MEIRKNFAKNLKLMLEDKKLTNMKFAKLIGVTDSCVSKWLYEQREPTLSNICKILEILNCTFEELME